MTNRNWTTVDGLLEAALERPPHARAAFLHEACADDGVRAEVESLLRHASAAGDFLNDSAVTLVLEDSADGQRGSFIGRQLGVHQILGLLGSGGMGDVYRAHDTKLDRDVAIKILPRVFSTDPDRHARLEREARMLAALSHPHIGGIYGVDELDGTPALLLELVEGDTLAERIAREPLPVDQALKIATQIANALDAAHGKGIVHRDLKPANIKITPDGVAKVLDFGLAKAVSPDGRGHDSAPSPTITAVDPLHGAMLGTPAYMSPEQARGKPIDKQADIWAFGCVLYEMLTGRAPFARDTVSDTIAAIVERDPSWAALPAAVPPAIQRLLVRCLEKDPRRRLHDIADARIEIDDALSRLSGDSKPALGAWSMFAAALVVALLAVVVWTVMSGRRVSTEGRPITFTIEPPGGMAVFVTEDAVAVSPDGTQIALLVRNADVRPRVWIRNLNSLSGQLLAGTEGATRPFWSPDGRFVAFFADQQLKKVALGGGPPETLCDIPTLAFGGGTWSRDGVLLFHAVLNGTQGIYAVSANGGTPKAVTRADLGVGSHRHPHFLPDGKRFLYLEFNPHTELSAIFVRSLDRDDRKFVVRANSNVAYLAPGYLLYSRDGTLMAHPFDAARAQTTGEPVPVAEEILQNAQSARALFAVSDAGTLAYRTGAATLPTSRLVWRNRRGDEVGTIGEPAAYRNPRLSPDGTRVTVELVNRFLNSDLWVGDVIRGNFTRLTAAPFPGLIGSGNRAPIWAPDGRYLAWRNEHSDGINIVRKLASGIGPEEVLLRSGFDDFLGGWVTDDWLPDATALIYHDQQVSSHAFGLRVLPLNGRPAPSLPFDSKSLVAHGRTSPDGRWLAYVTTPSGRAEVFVQDFPVASERRQVSIAGGSQPVWRRDGQELFYLAPNGMVMAVPITLTPKIDVGTPVPLFPTRMEVGSLRDLSHQYDVSADGRFLISELVSELAAPVRPPVTVIVNWAPPK